MKPVYLQGRGLACALGWDLTSAIEALRRGGVAPARVQVTPDLAWPARTLPLETDSRADAGGPLATTPISAETQPGDRSQRLFRAVRAAVGECGLPDPPSATPLLVASSSFSVGDEARTPTDRWVDAQSFADRVAKALDWRGPVFTVSTACTSAANAILTAMDLLSDGASTQALVLGIEFDNRFALAGFGGLQLLSPDRAQPFGAERNGLVLGEAVAALRLGVTPARWRLRGGVNQVNGATPTGADAQTLVDTCHAALRQAGLATDEIDLLKPQAAGSPGNDAVEAAGLKTLFGARLPPMVEFKSLIGHALGASAAAELALLAACLETGAWPASEHVIDPALGMTFAMRPPARCRHIMFNTIGFGGGHVALLIEDRHA